MSICGPTVFVTAMPPFRHELEVYVVIPPHMKGRLFSDESYLHRPGGYANITNMYFLQHSLPGAVYRLLMVPQVAAFNQPASKPSFDKWQDGSGFGSTLKTRSAINRERFARNERLQRMDPTSNPKIIVLPFTESVKTYVPKGAPICQILAFSYRESDQEMEYTKLSTNKLVETESKNYHPLEFAVAVANAYIALAASWYTHGSNTLRVVSIADHLQRLYAGARTRVAGSPEDAYHWTDTNDGDQDYPVERYRLGWMTYDLRVSEAYMPRYTSLPFAPYGIQWTDDSAFSFQLCDTEVINQENLKYPSQLFFTLNRDESARILMDAQLIFLRYVMSLFMHNVYAKVPKIVGFNGLCKSVLKTPEMAPVNRPPPSALNPVVSSAVPASAVKPIANTPAKPVALSTVMPAAVSSTVPMIAKSAVVSSTVPINAKSSPLSNEQSMDNLLKAFDKIDILISKLPTGTGSAYTPKKSAELVSKPNPATTVKPAPAAKTLVDAGMDPVQYALKLAEQLNVEYYYVQVA